MPRRSYAAASQPDEPDVSFCPLKNSFSRGDAFVTSASVSADCAPDSPEATETSVEKPELERAGSVMPYVSFPSRTASSTWDQVTCSGFQPNSATVAALHADRHRARHDGRLGYDLLRRVGTQPQIVVGGQPQGVVHPVRLSLRQHLDGVEGAHVGGPDLDAGVLRDLVEDRLHVGEFAGGEDTEGAGLGGAGRVRGRPLRRTGGGGQEGEGENGGGREPASDAHTWPPSSALRDRLRSK